MEPKAKQNHESVVKEIKRNTRLKFNSEEKIRIILEGLRGEDMIHTPAKYVRNATTQLSLQACLKSIINDIIIDVNGEVDALGDDFDYHNYLCDSKSIQTLARAVVK
jgi:hypothetical protein